MIKINDELEEQVFANSAFEFFLHFLQDCGKISSLEKTDWLENSEYVDKDGSRIYYKTPSQVLDTIWEQLGFYKKEM